MMHGDRDLRLELSHTFPGQVGSMVRRPPMGVRATSTLPNDLICRSFNFWLKSPRCAMHRGPRSKTNAEPMNALDEVGILMNGNIINERIFETHADGVPAGAVVFEPAQNQRIAQDDMDRIVIELLFAHGDDIADDVRVGYHPGPDGSVTMRVPLVVVMRKKLWPKYRIVASTFAA